MRRAEPLTRGKLEYRDAGLLSRSGLTRLVDKLEKEGLIHRKACPSDRRVQHAELTDKGVEVLRKIWPVYRTGITKYFAAHLSESEAKQVAAIFSRVRASLEPVPAEPAK